METYRLTFMGKAEQGAVVFTKRALHRALEQGLATIVSTNLPQKELVVRVEDRSILDAVVKKFSDRCRVDRVRDEARHDSPKPIQREDAPWLAKQLQTLQTEKTKLEGERDDALIKNMELEEEVERLRQSIGPISDIQGAATSYLRGQTSGFFELAAHFEKHSSRGELERILAVGNRAFIEYVNDALSKEGLPTYKSESDFKKDLDKSRQKFEELPDNANLVREYEEAKQMLEFLAQYKAGKVTGVPQVALLKIVQEWQPRESGLNAKVAEFERTRSVHERMQRIKFNQLEAEYTQAREAAQGLETTCNGRRIAYALITGATDQTLLLPIAPEHKKLWLAQQLIDYTIKSTGGENGEETPLVKVRIKEKTPEQVISDLQRGIQNYAFSKFGLNPEIVVVSQITIDALVDQADRMPAGSNESYSISQIAKMMGCSATWARVKVAKAIEAGQIKAEVTGDKRKHYSIPASELPKVKALF